MTSYVVSGDGFLPSAIILRDQRGMSLPAKPGAQSRLSPDARSKRELCHGQTTWPSAYLRPPGPLVRERPRCGQRLRAAHNESPAKPTTTDVPAASTACNFPSAKSDTLPTLTRSGILRLLVPGACL